MLHCFPLPLNLFKSHSPSFLLRLVAEWVKDIDYTAKSWTVEVELVHLCWIMHQHCDSHNILRNVSVSFPFATFLIMQKHPASHTLICACVH
jgi:hypothetical protein